MTSGPAQTAPYGEADLRAAAREGQHGRLYPGEGSREGVAPASLAGVRAAGAPSGGGAGGVGAGGGRDGRCRRACASAVRLRLLGLDNAVFAGRCRLHLTLGGWHGNTRCLRIAMPPDTREETKPGSPAATPRAGGRLCCVARGEARRMSLTWTNRRLLPSA